ncbi:MAG: phenylacetic acid degradation protein PaaN [Phycisphaerales bacterium]|nr:phenylacetic acid degradation protein PaaN [Phycisphaerales bacterium]
MSHPFFQAHRDALAKAVEAIHSRAYWSAYPEVPSGKVYGETAKDDGEKAFQSRLNRPFDLPGHPGAGQVGAEASPYGFDLGITYPKVELDGLFTAVGAAEQGWKKASVEDRVGVCLEILHRLNRRSFEMALAVMHTTGQGWMMAFQAGGPHAQDRGLEAVAYAWDEMQRTPAQAIWSKRVGKDETVTLRKTFRIVPRGIALTIGCSTFPTWNGYPGIFASLATGNAVVVKPHPGAILPLAITVEVARQVLAEAGFDPNVITLAADELSAPITRDIVQRPEIKIIDYTGGSAFGEWIEQNARQAIVYTEKAGVNSVIIDSVDNLKAVTGNLAFTLSLYSGQMCTTSQNIFIPREGIETSEGHKSFDEVAGALVKAVDWFLGEPKRAAEVLGAIQNENTARRVDQAKDEGLAVLRESTPVNNEAFPKARIRSPLILKADSRDRDKFAREMFGPIAYVVATANTDESIRLATEVARNQGAITCALYSTDPQVIHRAEEATADAGVPLSTNLTGSIWVNQAAAFSDFHVSGANPSGNATLCDSAFVAGRFRIVQSRMPVAN